MISEPELKCWESVLFLCREGKSWQGSLPCSCDGNDPRLGYGSVGLTAEQPWAGVQIKKHMADPELHLLLLDLLVSEHKASA